MATDNGARLPVPKSSGGPEESKEERPLLIDLNMEATREVTEEGHQTSVEKQGKAATNELETGNQETEAAPEIPMAMELPDTAAQPPETATILEVEGEAGTSTPENFSAPMQSAVPVNADLEATTFKAKGKEDESKGRLIDQQEAEVEEALARMQTDNDAEDEREEHRWLREEARGGDRAKDANNMVNRVKGAEVFVGGLQRMTTEEDLREMFAKAGEILELRLMHDKAGGPKGFAFIRFTNKESAQNAVQMHDATFVQGRRIGVTISNEQDTLFLGNLRKEWSPSDLEVLVRQTFQNVVSIELAMPPSTGESPPRADPKRKQNRGFGFVKFTNHGAAARAYRLAQRGDFLLGGKWKPVVDWADTDPEIPEEEMAKVTTAFLGNLPKEVTEEFLAKHFEPFGPIIRVAISRKTSTPVAFVHYEERRSLDAAIKALDGKVVEIPEGPKFKLQVQLAKPAEKIPLKKRPRPDREDPRGTRHAALRSPAPPGPGHFSDFSYPKPALGFNDSGYGDAFDRGRLGRSSRGRGRGAYADRGDRVYADRGFGGGGYDRGYDRGFGEPLRPYSRDGPPSRGYASRGGYERDYPPERGTAYAELDRPPYEGRSAGGGYASRGGAFVDVVGGPYDDLERVPGFIERRGDVNMARGAFDDRKGDFGRIGDGGFGARGVELEPYRKLQRGGSYAAGMGKYPGQALDPYDEAINALPSPVAHKLTRIFRDGVASRHDVDIHILDSLRDLPEQAAASVLDQFSSMDLRAVRSKGAYLDGEVARVRRELAAASTNYIEQIDSDWDYPPQHRGANAPSANDPPLGYSLGRTGQEYGRPASGLAVGSGRSALSEAPRSYGRLERPPHNLPHEDELLYDDGRDAAALAPYGAYSAELSGHALGLQSRAAGSAATPAPQFRFDPYTGEPLERSAAPAPQFRIDGSGQYFIVPP